MAPALVVAALEMDRDMDVVSLASGSGASASGSGASASDSGALDSGACTPDTVLTSLLKDMGVEFFSCLEDIDPVIDAYEAKTGFRLCIRRSVHGRYRWYRCRAHINCPFEIRIGKRRSDGMFFVRLTVNYYHGVEREAAVASGGRQWKVRRAGKLDGIIREVLNAKKEAPTPADIIHTAKGVKIPYMGAWRALKVQTVAACEDDSMKYQLVILYLMELKRRNPLSVIGYSCDADHRLRDVHVFPGFMDRALAFVRPVICLDAAPHLNGSEKGTLYVASCLSGANEVYPIGFMIAKGNEDREAWTKMLSLLKECCPSLLTCKEVNVPDYGNYQHAFLFMSDRDKGLQPALTEVFPNNISMSCAMHIKANVAQRYGQACSRDVINIAKSYSIRYASYLIDQVRRIKPEAAEYIDTIADLWRSSDWLLPGRNSLDPTQVMPPRYGIVTSNTSESVNNMLKPARDVGWLDSIDIIIDIMSTRIYKCRMEWITKPPNEVVSRVQQIIQMRWDASTQSTVVELNQTDGIFRVSDSRNDDVTVVNDAAATPVVLGRRSATHTVNPGLHECTCGAWQDLLYPCRHACAVYRHHYRKTFQDMMELVHPFYKYKSVHKLYEDNMFPVCMDNLKHDGVTKPPLVCGRQAGRPRTKRIRRWSEIVDPSASKVQCSLCRRRGHNKRTCTSQET